MSAPCCKMMAADLGQRCDVHKDRFDCPDALVTRNSDGSFGLIVHDGGSSFIAISFCPWCGERLTKEP